MSKDIDQNGNISQISQPIEDLFDFKIGEYTYSYYIMKNYTLSYLCVGE